MSTGAPALVLVAEAALTPPNRLLAVKPAAET
jgi:hypothetical protein